MILISSATESWCIWFTGRSRTSQTPHPLPATKACAEEKENGQKLLSCHTYSLRRKLSQTLTRPSAILQMRSWHWSARNELFRQKCSPVFEKDFFSEMINLVMSLKMQSNISWTQVWPSKSSPMSKNPNVQATSEINNPLSFEYSALLKMKLVPPCTSVSHCAAVSLMCKVENAVHLCWAWEDDGVERGQCRGGGVVGASQLAWVSTHLSLLLSPLLCQTLLLQINKCWTNFSLLKLCRLLHNNEGWCCQRLCPASNDPPVWADNEERMYSYRRTPLLLCTFFCPGLSWLWR